MMKQVMCMLTLSCNRRYACSNSRRKLLREFVIYVFHEISMVTRVEGTFRVSLLAT